MAGKKEEEMERKRGEGGFPLERGEIILLGHETDSFLGIGGFSCVHVV